MKQKIKWILLITSLLITGCATGYSSTGNTTDEQVVETNSGYVKAERGNYDSIDTAIVVKKVDGTDSITLCNIETGKNYTLTYNMDTTITNQYEEVITMGQIVVGDIVDVTFMREQRWLNTIMISPSAWHYTNVSNYKIEDDYKSMTVASEQYKLYHKVVAASEDAQLALLDVNEMDVITLKGIGQTVYSITVDRGHGYLRLENADYFVGGWIQIGKELVLKVTENMLITVPEGTYDVQVSNKGTSGTKEISVARKQEVRLDLLDMSGEDTRTGKLLFMITPSDAIVTIDGEEVDISEVLEYEYGIHQLKIEAQGYETIEQFVKVGQVSASIAIEMEPIEEEEDDKEETEEEKEETDDSVSGNQILNTAVEGYVVRIDGPEGVQVYVDNVYVGIAPISFPKVSGEHTIILAQDGHETRTYTIQVDKEEKDIVFAFSGLTTTN